MKKILRRIAIWVGIPFAILIIISLIIAGAFGDKIGRLIVSELKKSLKTELTVEDVNMTILTSFPYASANLNNIKLYDTTKETYLLQANTLSFKIGLWGLITGDYQIQKVDVINAEIFIATDKQGRKNYDVFKDDGKPSNTPQKETSSELNLSIKEANFHNVKLIYADEVSKKEAAIRLDQAFFAGDFKSQKYTLKSDAQLYIGYINIEGSQYLKSKEISYSTSIDIDKSAHIYTVGESQLTLDGSTFKVYGNVKQPNDKDSDYDLTIKGEEVKLGTILELAAGGSDSPLGDFESNADLNFISTIKGISNKDKLPQINATMSINDGKINHPRMESAIKDVSFKMSFTSGTKGTGEDARLDISEFAGKLSGKPMDMKLTVKGMDNPYIDFACNGKIALSEVYGFLGEQVSNADGVLDFERLYVKGKLKDLTSSAGISSIDAGGVVSIEDVVLEQNDEKMQIKTGRIVLENNDFSISNFYAEGAGSDFSINGQCQNLIPVILADSVNSKNAVLNFEASLTSQKLDLEKLTKFFHTEPTANTNTKEKKDKMGGKAQPKQASITDMLDGTFKTSIRSLTWGKVKAENLTGELTFKDKSLNIKGLNTSAFDGSIELNAKIVFGQTPTVEAYLDTRSIEIQKLFEQFENFEQTQLTDKNISGKLISTTLIRGEWDADANFNYDKLYALSDIKLKNGTLDGWDMMKQFSKFAKIKDLEHIEFTELHNQFEIKDRALVIPAMFIQSNALNLSMAGKQTFDGDFNYFFKVNAGQVLMSKFKRFNNYEPVPAKKNGLFNIHVSVFGNINKGTYDWKFDKKGVKNALEGESNKAFQAIENNLKREFENEVQPISEPDDSRDIPEFGSNTNEKWDDAAEQPEKFLWEN